MSDHPWETTGKPYSTRDDMDQVIQSLQNNEGLEWDKFGYDLVVRKIDLNQFLELNERTGVVHLASIVFRSGFGEFFNRLETRYFEPDTLANRDFEFRYFKWEDALFVVATIPEGHLLLASAVAEEMGFELHRTVPVIMSVGRGKITGSLGFEKSTVPEFQGFNWFPITKNLYTLEGQKVEQA